MYPAYAKWVQSHRDLPIKLNQWCNVVVGARPFSPLSSRLLPHCLFTKSICRFSLLVHSKDWEHGNIFEALWVTVTVSDSHVQLLVKGRVLPVTMTSLSSRLS